MTATGLRIVGLCLTVLYAGVLARVYIRQPATLPEASGTLSLMVGAYRIDRERFDAGLRYFREDRFREARDAFAQADPARLDPVVQFYVAYAYLRQGWGRVYSDDDLYRQGLEALTRARALAPGGTIRVDDDNLRLKTAEELQAEFERGLTRELSDLNPARLLRERP